MQGINKTVGDMINQISNLYPNREALVHQERDIRYTYGSFLEEINRVAKGLIEMGLVKGDKVVLWGTNIPEWILVQIAMRVVRKDQRLNNFYTRVRKRSSAKKARVAVARKLAGICWVRLMRWHQAAAA